jgi:methylmalonyl-CoA mutase
MTAAPPKPPEDLALASLFDPASREQWQGLVATALRKSGLLEESAAADTVDAVLTTHTYDGVDVLPLYTAAPAGAPAPATGVPGVFPFVRGARAEGAVASGWDVRQRHAHPDPARTREAVMADLENGVTSLWLTIGPAGLPLGCLDDVLRDVYLDLAPVVLDAGDHTWEAAQEFFGVIDGRGVLPEQVRGNLGADPIGRRARRGTPAGAPSVQASFAQAADLAQRCVRDYPGLRAITVDATVYHDAGGSDAQELGAALATGLACLRALTDAGLTIEQALGQLEFRYAVTADQFASIAKLRAARQVWSRLAQVSGAPQAACAQVQHAVTSSAMMSQRDPWVNLLRTTLASFGAGVGGADAVTVQPFDAALGLPDAFSRRIARNTSSLLTMESNVARVIDPAGGSWYVEQLTADLAQAAWDWFTQIERAGGIEAALDSGLIERELAATWEQRVANLAVRKDALTGVSEFPNLTEKPVVREPAPAAGPAGPGALPVRRYAQDYEALRDAADAAAASTGTRGAVFVAALGPASAYTARSTFAANLFQAGGLATPVSDGGTDPGALAAAFTASGAAIACIASSDRVYGEHAAAAAAALKQAGAQRVWLAGQPGERAESDAAAGIDGYVFTGCDALAVLRQAHAEAGIQSEDH